MIEVGNIVTLENGQEYLLLEELENENGKYVYAVRTLEDETPTDEFIIFEVVINDGEEYLKIVSDKKIYDNLIEDFKDIVTDKLLSGDYDDMEQVSSDTEEA